MPGAVLTPDTVLAQTLEKARAGRIKSVMVVMEWEDGAVDVDWSLMPMSTAAFMAKSVDRWILQLLDGNVDLD